MKFTIPEPPAGFDSDALRVGNIYRCKGGNKTDYFVVINFDDKSVQLLGLNRDGIITSATSYSRYVFEGTNFSPKRTPIGFCDGLEDLTFDIQWRDPE